MSVLAIVSTAVFTTVNRAANLTAKVASALSSLVMRTTTTTFVSAMTLPSLGKLLKLIVVEVEI